MSWPLSSCQIFCRIFATGSVSLKSSFNHTFSL
jgi:hypothetical protein